MGGQIINRRYIYLVSGWTNHEQDARKIGTCYDAPKPKYKTEGPNKILRSPCRIVASEQELTRSSTHVSHIVLHYLGLIPLKENEKIIYRNMVHECFNQHDLDNVRIIPGRFGGIELNIEEVQPSWWDIDLDKIVIPRNKAYDGFMEMHRVPLAGIPRHSRILSREKALDELVRRGYELFVPFFQKAVEKYEGREI